MKNIILTISIFFFSNVICIGQIQFQWIISGPSVNIARSIIQTSDAGYAIAGYTKSFGAGNSDIYVVKLSSVGAIQWTKTFGGVGNEYGYTIKQTSDGGFIICGVSNSFGPGGGDFYIIKLDDSGNLQWNRSLGGAAYDYALSVVQTIDGGYAVAGNTNSFGAGAMDMYIVKLDGSGMIQWSKTIGGTINEGVNSIIQTLDGGFTLAGYTISYGAGSTDIFIVKLDVNGSLQWSRTVGGTNAESANSILQTIDGNLIAAGYTLSFGTGPADFYIVKFNPNGSLLWTSTLGGVNTEVANSITKTRYGNILVTGRTNSFGSNDQGDIYTVKLDASGSLLESRKLGGLGEDEAMSIIETIDGGYALAGAASTSLTSNQKFFVLKTDTLWNICGNSTIVSSISGNGGILGNTPTVITSPATIMNSPTCIIQSGGILTEICLTGIESIQSEIPTLYELYQNYPNPFNPTTKITFDINLSSNIVLKVYDVKSVEVETLVNEKLAAGKYQIDWNAANYPSGIYFYKLETEDYISTKKMILVK